MTKSRIEQLCCKINTALDIVKNDMYIQYNFSVLPTLSRSNNKIAIKWVLLIGAENPVTFHMTVPMASIDDPFMFKITITNVTYNFSIDRMWSWDHLETDDAGMYAYCIEDDIKQLLLHNFFK